MIQTHAYDGWVAAASRGGWGYRVTRELGSIPAPIFLLLAGMGLGMADASSERRGADPSATRRDLALRGLKVLLAGYVVSLAYACIDWSFAPEVILRADILHAIGLSLFLSSLLLLRRPHALLLAFGLTLIVVSLPILLAPLLPAVSFTPLPVRTVVGLIVDVRGLTRFPVLPLIAFVAIGHAFGRVYRPGLVSAERAWVGVLLLAVAAAAMEWATGATVHAIGMGPLTRSHPAVALNLLDGTFRALAVVAFAIAVTPSLPARLRDELARLGRASLFAYAIHIPFAYGRLARPLSRRLDMPTATLAYVVLCVLVWLAVLARDRVRERRREGTAGSKLSP